MSKSQPQKKKDSDDDENRKQNHIRKMFNLSLRIQTAPYIASQILLLPLARYICLRQTDINQKSFLHCTSSMLRGRSQSQLSIYFRAQSFASKYLRPRIFVPVVPIGIMLAVSMSTDLFTMTFLTSMIYSERRSKYLEEERGMSPAAIRGRQMLQVHSANLIVQTVFIYPLFKLYTHLLSQPHILDIKGPESWRLTEAIKTDKLRQQTQSMSETLMRKPYRGYVPFLLTVAIDQLATQHLSDAVIIQSLNRLQAGQDGASTQQMVIVQSLVRSISSNARDSILEQVSALSSIALATFLAYPFEVIWRRMVINDRAKMSGEPEFEPLARAIKKAMLPGSGSLLRGFVPCVLRNYLGMLILAYTRAHIRQIDESLFKFD